MRLGVDVLRSRKRENGTWRSDDCLRSKYQCKSVFSHGQSRTCADMGQPGALETQLGRTIQYIATNGGAKDFDRHCNANGAWIGFSHGRSGLCQLGHCEPLRSEGDYNAGSDVDFCSAAGNTLLLWRQTRKCVGFIQQTPFRHTCQAPPVVLLSWAQFRCNSLSGTYCDELSCRVALIIAANLPDRTVVQLVLGSNVMHREAHIPSRSLAVARTG